METPSMSIEHGLGVAGALAERAEELLAAIRRANEAVREATEMADELRLECEEFSGDCDFVAPFVFETIREASETVVGDLTGDHGGASTRAAEQDADELAAVLRLGTAQLRRQAERRTLPAEKGEA